MGEGGRISNEHLVLLGRSLDAIENEYRPTCQSASYGSGCPGATDESLDFWRRAVDSIPAMITELRERRAAITAFADAVSRAVRANEQRGKGGQQVPFFDDFCNAPPSVLVQLQRWVRMLNGEK